MATGANGTTGATGVTGAAPALHQGPFALVVAPTRELACQIQREFALLSEGKKFRAVVLSKSNMGSYMLTQWGALNHATLGPPLVDMDAKVHKGQLLKGRHFCSLSWGSRHGMCESNQTDEWVGPPLSGPAEAASGAKHRGVPKPPQKQASATDMRR